MEYPVAKRVHSCCVRNCKNKGGRRHRFPKNQPDTFKAWLEMVKPRDYKTLSVESIYNRYYICDDHFSAERFVPGTRRGLKVYAVPTVNIPQDNSGKLYLISNITKILLQVNSFYFIVMLLEVRSCSEQISIS